MGLDKKLSQLKDCPLPTNNTHIIMSTKITHRDPGIAATGIFNFNLCEKYFYVFT
jgi:hypothetical protein